MEQTMSSTLDVKQKKDLLRMMMRIREFEDRVAESYLRGMTAGSMFHLSVGEEAIAAGMGCAMKEQDYFTTHHRGHGIFIAKGADLGRMFAEVFGRIDGYCKGKGGSMHIADVRLGHMGANAIVGANIPISLGGGFSIKYQKLDAISVAFFGDGALNQGVLYESMNMAALWKLPVIFAVVNNQYGMGTRIDKASASLRFADRAETFGVRGVEVDGMDVEAVWNASQELYDAARSGKGPGLIVANAYRFYGHGRKDPSPYRSKEEESEWKDRDPIALYHKRLVEEQILTDAEMAELDQKVKSEVDGAVEWAAASPAPTDEQLYTDVYVSED
jgi:acetoin:2,6-dichlorophenolindophenol oxidoreductase subunit alpha